jgi:hypothetical protein
VEADAAREWERLVIFGTEQAQMCLRFRKEPMSGCGNGRVFTCADRSTTHAGVHARGVIGQRDNCGEATLRGDVNDNPGNIRVLGRRRRKATLNGPECQGP